MKRYEITTAPFAALLDNFFADMPTATHPHRDYFAVEPNRWAQFKVHEQENGFLVEAELAGVKKEDLKIEVLGDTLKISGSRGTKEDADKKLCAYAEFSRSITLGKGVDTDRIEAQFENGYLNLLIPRLEAPKAKVINVK